MKRSTMKASASTEHRISGQIGQPAACMIESKDFSGCRPGVAGAVETGAVGGARMIIHHRRARPACGFPAGPFHEQDLWITL
jgi:hypothetical protein